MQLFGVGALEALLVMVITLIVVGPQRFPEIARQGGRWFRVGRRFAADVTADFREALHEIEEEVVAEGDDLHAVREIGEEIGAGLRENSADLDQLRRDTERAAEQAGTGTERPASAAEQHDGDGEPPEPTGEATPRGEGASQSPSQRVSSPPPIASPVTPPERESSESQGQLSDATPDLPQSGSPGREHTPDA